MGRYLETSSLFSFSGFTMGISLATFHLFGETPFRRQPLYKAVIYLGSVSKALYNTSPVIPSTPDSFFFFMLTTAVVVSSTLKSLSSSVSAGSRVWALASLWCSVSSSSLSTGVKCSSMSCRVSLKSSVKDPSGFHRVVICVLFLLFPAASLYTLFHGLEIAIFLPGMYFLPFNCCFVPCFFG